MLLVGCVVVGSIVYVGTRAYKERRRMKNLVTFLQTQSGDDPPPTRSIGSRVPKAQRLAKYVVPASLALVGLGLAWYVWLAAPCYLAPLSAANQLIGFLRSSGDAPLLYTLVYAASPLVLFPAALLTTVGGFLFGSVWGSVYAVVGSTASALVAYGIGHYFGQRLLQGEQSEALMERYAYPLRRYPFETVLTMRCLFLPYEPVSYLAGFLQIGWRPFLLATVLGSLPGNVVFGLFGSAVKANLIRGVPHLNIATLAASGGLLGGSLVLSRYLKPRAAEGDTITEEREWGRVEESDNDLMASDPC